MQGDSHKSMAPKFKIILAHPLQLREEKDMQKGNYLILLLTEIQITYKKRDIVDLKLNFVSNKEVSVGPPRALVVNGRIYRVEMSEQEISEKVKVEWMDLREIEHNSLKNLGWVIFDDSSTTGHFVYVDVEVEQNGASEDDESAEGTSSSNNADAFKELERRSRIVLKKINIYSLRNVNVTKYKAQVVHENPHTISVSVEYEIHNGVPFSVRYVYLDLDVDLPLSAIEVKDEKGNPLRFFKEQDILSKLIKLRGSFKEEKEQDIRTKSVEDDGRDVKRDSTRIFVDLGGDLGRDRTKILKVNAVHGLGKWDYMEVPVVPNVEESVEIRAQQGYLLEVEKVKRQGSEKPIGDKGKDAGQNGQYEYPVFSQGDRVESLRVLGNYLLDASYHSTATRRAYQSGRVSSSGSNGSAESAEKDITPLVRIEFKLSSVGPDRASRGNFKDEQNYFMLKIPYSVEVEHREFWETILGFFSVVIVGLYTLGLFLRYSVITWGTVPTPFLVYGFGVGGVTGFILSFIFMRVLTTPSEGVKWYVYLFFLALLTVVTLSFDMAFHNPSAKSLLENFSPTIVQIAGVAFAGVTLTNLLAERAAKETYRVLILYLIVLSVLSMIVVIP